MGLAAFVDHLVVLSLYMYIQVTIAVKWSLRTDPIVFRHDVTLFCSLPNNFNKGYPRRWIGGNKVLTLNEGHANENKYEGSLEEDGFTLTIKKFAVEDFRKKYSCQYGFEEYTANLTTTEYQWQPEPGTSKLIMNSTINEVQLVIQFEKVYPEPSCTSLIGVQPTEANFTITKETVDRYFFAVNMNLKYVYGRFECGENISVVCTVGNKSMIFTKATPRNCTVLDPGDRKEYIIVVICVFAVMAIGVIVLYPVVWRLKIKLNCLYCITGTCSRNGTTSKKTADEDPTSQEKDVPKTALSKKNGADEGILLTNVQINNQYPAYPSAPLLES